MESIINKNQNNNLDNQLIQNIKKTCPFCNIIISLEEYQDHILCHELEQNENGNYSNNVNDFGIKGNNENNIQNFKTPQFINFFKTKINNLRIFNNNNNDNNINNINNRNNNVNNINNINNINNLNVRNNNTSNNNIIDINNVSDDDDDSGDNFDTLNKVKSKISNFFKGLSKKNEDSDDSNSSNNEPISLPILRSIRGIRRRRRSSSINDINISDNNDNNNNIDDDLLLEDILNDIKLNDDYKEILRYIPTSTVKEIKKNSENNKCVICLSDFQIGEQESTLPCLHFFHSNCIEKWISEKKWCPICKYDISLKSLLSENNI